MMRDARKRRLHGKSLMSRGIYGNCGIMNRFILFTLIVLNALCPQPAAALDHGEEQLARFLETRPETAVLLAQDSDYRRFLINAFGGMYTSVPLFWDSAEPQGNAYAENTPNDERTRIIIRVSRKLSAPDQVAALVYECMNAQNEHAFARYIKDVYLGDLNRTQFIQRILRLEHIKLKQVRAFLKPLEPFSSLDASRTEFYRKMLATPDDFEEFLEYLVKIKRDDYDVFDMYSKFYDFITATPEIRKAQMDRERQQAEGGPDTGEWSSGAGGGAPPPVVKGEQVF